MRAHTAGAAQQNARGSHLRALRLRYCAKTQNRCLMSAPGACEEFSSTPQGRQLRTKQPHVRLTYTKRSTGSWMPLTSWLADSWRFLFHCWSGSRYGPAETLARSESNRFPLLQLSHSCLRERGDGDADDAAKNRTQRRHQPRKPSSAL
jgi:hypothetical protein